MEITKPRLFWLMVQRIKVERNTSLGVCTGGEIASKITVRDIVPISTEFSTLTVHLED